MCRCKTIKDQQRGEVIAALLFFGRSVVPRRDHGLAAAGVAWSQKGDPALMRWVQVKTLRGRTRSARYSDMEVRRKR